MVTKELTHGLDLSGMLEVCHKDIPIETMIVLRRKGLSHQQIATLLGCSKANIQKRLSKVQYEVDTIDDFKNNRADVLALHQRRVVNAITETDLESASLKDKSIAFGILYDKERLERGQSTSNVLYADLLAAKKEKLEELKQLEAKMEVRGVRLYPFREDNNGG